jgi:hypothetical protein
VIRRPAGTLGPWLLAATLCGCTYDFDHYAPEAPIAADGSPSSGRNDTGPSSSEPDTGPEPRRDGAPIVDVIRTDAGLRDATSGVDGSTSREAGSDSSGCADARADAAADAQLPTDASTNPCPSQRPAEGDACDPIVSNRSCRFNKVNCTCSPCGWTCK